MTIEEKAKRYDGALHAAKAWHNTFISTKEYKNLKQLLETIFPELAESEDERISKEIIYFLSRNTFQFGEDIDKYKSWNAWLEKQGKPKWSEEDERGSDETLELLEYFINYTPEFRRPAIRRSIDWIKSLKERMEEQQ